MKDETSETPKASSYWRRFWAFPILAVAWAVGLLVGRFESVALADAAGVSTAVILLILFVYWDVRKESWFFPFFIAVGIAHFLAVIFVPWPKNYHIGKQDILFGLADLIPMLVIGYFIAKITHAPSTIPDR